MSRHWALGGGRSREGRRPCCRRDRRRSAANGRAEWGFTLIETIVATALAASVAIAALAAVTRFSRHARREGSAGRLPEAMADLLETDLLQAERFFADAAGPVLFGRGAIGDASTLPRGPARIAYEVRSAGGRSWLLRRQTVADALGRPTDTVELVCADVTRLSIAPVDDRSPADETLAGDTNGASLVPAVVVVTVERGQSSEGSPTVWRRTFVLR